MNRVLWEFKRAQRETFRVSLGESQGRAFVDLRIWQLDNTTGKPEASTFGVNVWGEQLADVIAALSVARQRIALTVSPNGTR